jgi:hypothetical protein
MHGCIGAGVLPHALVTRCNRVYRHCCHDGLEELVMSLLSCGFCAQACVTACLCKFVWGESYVCWWVEHAPVCYVLCGTLGRCMFTRYPPCGALHRMLGPFDGSVRCSASTDLTLTGHWSVDGTHAPVVSCIVKHPVVLQAAVQQALVLMPSWAQTGLQRSCVQRGCGVLLSTPQSSEWVYQCCLWAQKAWLNGDLLCTCV